MKNFAVSSKVLISSAFVAAVPASPLWFRFNRKTSIIMYDDRPSDSVVRLSNEMDVRNYQPLHLQLQDLDTPKTKR